MNPFRPVALAALTLAMPLLGQEPKAPTLELERTFFVAGGQCHSLAWSPDGRWLASGGDRGEVVVIDADDGSVRFTLAASDHWVGDVRFSPDSKRLAAVGRDVSLWSLQDGKLVARHPAGSAKALDWSRDGRWIACILGNQSAVILDAQTLRQTRILELADKTAADAVAFHPDGSKLAVGKRSGTTQVFDTTTGERIRTLEQKGWVQDLAYLDDGRLVRCGWKGQHYLFGDEAETFGKYAYGLRAQPDGSRIVVRSNEATAVFTPDGGKVMLNGNGCMALHPDGKHWARIVAGDVHVLNGTEVVRRLGLPHRGEPDSAVLTGDERFVVTQSDKQLHVFDAATGAAMSAKGLPKLATPLATPWTPDLVLWQGVTPDGKGKSKPATLEFWRLGATPRQVRRIVFGAIRQRGMLTEPPQLSANGRHLGVTDWILDLMRPTEHVHVDDILMRGMVPNDAGTAFLGLHAIFDSFGGGLSQPKIFDASGKVLAQRRFSFGISEARFRPRGDRVAMATTAGLKLLDRDLQIVEEWELSWPSARWLDDEWLLGCSSGGILATLHVDGEKPRNPLNLGSWARSLHLSARGDHAVVALADRVVLVRVKR